MIKRPWDPENKYLYGLLKSYENWVLEINYKQHTLGAYAIFCKRGIREFSRINKAEASELTTVMSEMERALCLHNAFSPSKFDYFHIGGGKENLCIDGIPRYKFPRDFAGILWVDRAWDESPELVIEDSPDQIILAIRNELAVTLEEAVANMGEERCSPLRLVSRRDGR